MDQRPLFVYQIGSIDDRTAETLWKMGYEPIAVYPPCARPLPVILTIAGERSPWLVRFILGLRIALSSWK